jgi:protein O-mannosyl-transferase
MAKRSPEKKTPKKAGQQSTAAGAKGDSPPSSPKEPGRRRWPIWLLLLALILIPAWVFWPGGGYEFVNWDDPTLVVENPQIKQFSPHGIKEILLHSARISNYYIPWTFLSYSVDYVLFGLNPGAFHRVNVLLHVLNGLLVFVFFYLLSRNLFLAFGGAALFAVHPLNVEAVAWVAERKGLWGAFFLLSSLISYLRYLERPSRKFLIGSILFFFLSLLSKPVGLMFPFLLLLLDRFRGRGWNRSMIYEKIPFFLGSVLFGIQSLWGQESGGVIGSRAILALDNVLAASYGLLLYLSKFFLPIRLSALYPYPDGPSIFYPVLAGIWLGVIFYLRRYREIFFGQAFFLIALLPAMKLVPFGDFVAADRLVYFPLLGFFFLAGWAFSRLESWTEKSTLYLRAPVFLSLALVLAILAGMSRERMGVWENGEKLWKSALAVSPEMTVALTGLGDFYADKGRLEEGISEYRKALSIDPRHPMTLNNLGTAYQKKGLFEEAMEAYRKAVEINPRYTRAYTNLGVAYEQRGMFDEAISAHLNALETDPRSALLRTNLGAAYLAKGRVDEAIAEHRKALALDPTQAVVYNNLGMAFRRKGLGDEAIRAYRQAIEMNPRYAPAYTNLGLAYEQKGMLAEAISFYSQAVEIDPRSAQARTNLGAAYMRKGLVDKAIEEHRKAITLDPQLALAHGNLGAAYGQKGMLDEAIGELKQALLLDPRYAKAHYNLGVAYLLKNDRKLADVHFGQAVQLGHPAPPESSGRNQP